MQGQVNTSRLVTCPSNSLPAKIYIKKRSRTRRNIEKRDFLSTAPSKDLESLVAADDRLNMCGLLQFF